MNQAEQHSHRPNSLSDLRDRRSCLISKREKAQGAYNRLIVAVLFIVLFAPAVLWLNRSEAPELALVFFPYLFAPLAMVPLYRSRLREIESDIQTVEFEIDLLQYDGSKRERRAEKILQINDFQLRRYYNLNLNQNLWIFALGIACMVIGVAIISVSMYVVGYGPDSRFTKDSKIIIAILGAVGSIMTNFVAAIYLRMHAAATANLASFHSKLVEAQRIFLGNLLASRIEQDELRWETLSQLSLRLVADHDQKSVNV